MQLQGRGVQWGELTLDNNNICNLCCICRLDVMFRNYWKTSFILVSPRRLGGGPEECLSNFCVCLFTAVGLLCLADEYNCRIQNTKLKCRRALLNTQHKTAQVE